MEIAQQKAVGVTVGLSLYSILVFVLVGLLARNPADLGSLVGFFTVLLAICWVAAMGCGYIALHSLPRHRQVLSGVSALALVFAGLFSVSAIIGAVLVWLSLTNASHVVASGTTERTKIRLAPILLPGLRLLFIGLALAVAALILPQVRSQVSGGQVALSSGSVDLLLRPMAPILESVLPGYTPEATIDQLIDNQLRQQEQALPPGVSLAPGQRIQVRQELAGRFGLTLNGSETFADVLTNYLNVYIRRLGDQNGILVIALLLVLGFLAVRAIIPLLSWLALGVAMGIFWLMRRFELVHIIETQAPVEALQL